MNTKYMKKKQKYVVRCDRAGVFYGEIEQIDGSTVKMRNVRKTWYWDGACAVEELATNGTTRPATCKFTVTVDSMTVLEAVQIIPCTDKAVESLDAVKEWKRG